MCVFHGLRFKVCGGCRETSYTFFFNAFQDLRPDGL